MKYSEYNITNSEGKSNCVIRSLCKILNKDYDTVYNELCAIEKELNTSSYTDIIVFEEYMNINNIKKDNYPKDIKIKDLKLDHGSYIIFCYDKKDYYHMVTIIDNTLYDKSDKSLDMYVINVYRKV